MSDALDRAVDARVDAYRPDRVPPFEAVQARKHSRDRRRGAAAAAAVALAVAGVVFLPTAFGLGGGDEGPPTVAEGGAAAAIFGYRVRADNVAAFRAAGEDALTYLEGCLQYPGLSDGERLESDPAQYSGRVAGQDQAEAFQACIEKVPGMTATLTPVDPAPATESPAPGSMSLASRFEDPPAWPGHPWHKNGQPVPESELVLARGDAHCGAEDTAYIGGAALGTNGGDAFRSVWSRDPNGVINETTRDGFRARAELPPDAAFTGYTQGAVELWVAPSDRGEYVYLVNAENRSDVERWVAGGGGCA
jgi:hypothetical protein